ncbi:hypothetical protein [Demequina sp. NBRC 110057]|uniref:primosomal protein N' family DNA-binding protein n=1 Tax=Demequina sp. NBRC 110057 TaxID=1570346 RepID=UPI000A0064CC|nr:hypothetical protein [Demequina sp. NBRC 110057]
MSEGGVGDDALFSLPAPGPAPAPAPSRKRRAAPPVEDEAGPVARVRVDSPLPHLDKPLDYRVPPKLADTVEVGSRVRVPMAGQLVSAVVTAIAENSDFDGALARVKSSSLVPSFTPDAVALAERIARRYAGSTWDVLRLMAPPRVLAVEKRDWDAPDPDPAYAEALAAAPGSTGGLALRPGDRVVWQGLPEADPRTSVPARAMVEAALAAVGEDASAVLVVPDGRSIGAVLAECERRGLTRWRAGHGGQVAVLDADDGPSVRFGSYVAAMRGHARIVVGTRPAVMQPVPRLGLLMLWDEANGVYEELHAPYPHARTIAAMRAEEGAAVVIGGYALSADAIALVEHGWARSAVPSRDEAREAVPAMDILTQERRDAEGPGGWHWMPSSAWRALTKARERGPVAVMVPRAGYVHAAACATCDAWALCRQCESPLALPAAGAVPVCLENGHTQPDWHCPECHGHSLKHLRQGIERIAEQLQRMAPDVPLTVSSAATGVVADLAVDAGIVVATPAALPAVSGGYAHLVIVDAGVPAHAGLGAELRAVRWWITASALVRSRADGGAVTIVGELPDLTRRALSTWSPVDAAREEFAERAPLGFPPHRRHVEVTGDQWTVDAALSAAGVSDGGDGATVIARPDGASLLLPRGRAQAVVDALRTHQQRLSAARGKERAEVRLKVDGPLELPR